MRTRNKLLAQVLRTQRQINKLEREANDRSLNQFVRAIRRQEALGKVAALRKGRL